MKKSANWLPIMTWPACSGVSQDKQYGRFPLQEMSQIKFNPSSEVTRETGIGTANVLWPKVQEISPVVDEQLIIAENPSSSCCSDEAIVNEDNSSLDNLCQRVFDACSCKQQGVIALRKFATILGASRHLLMDIFSVLSIIKVVEEQGTEKYIWLGSNRIEDALQELLVNQNQSNLSTQKDCKAGLHKDTEILSLSELGTRFCLLFLSNKYADIKWEFAVDALLSKIKGSAREGIRTTLWKISVILSALHLIVSKRGPVFKWSGSEGVAAHLNSLAHSRLVQRCPEASYCPKKRKKIDLEDVDGDFFADDRDELSSFCNQVQICRSPDGKRSRLSLTLPGSACDSDVERVSQSSSAMKCISIGSTNTEYRYSLEELQNRRIITSHPSSTEFGCRKCMKCLQNSLGMLCSEDEDDHNGKNRTFAALYQVSTSCTNDVAHLCRLSSPGKQKLCFTCCQPVAACYLDCNMVNSKESQEGRLSNCNIPLLHCLVSKVDGSPTITDDPAEPALENVNWHFDPLASLSSIYTPQQVITMQQCNPGFLINFVRYYRQLYHKYGCKSDALVHLPFAIRPRYSSFCLVKNLAAKVTSFTTNHSGPTGMLQRNANLAPPEKFP